MLKFESFSDLSKLFTTTRLILNQLSFGMAFKTTLETIKPFIMLKSLVTFDEKNVRKMATSLDICVLL